MEDNKIPYLDSNKRKTIAEIGSIHIPKDNSGEFVMDCFKFYKARNASNAGDPTKLGVSERYDSFVHALNYSYNSEKIKIVGKSAILPHYEEEYLSLIVPDDKKGIKRVCIPFELNPDVGDLVYWARDNSYWLITTAEETEKAYFKGNIEKCNYILSWRDDNGNVYKQRVKLQGPVETKYKNENLGEFISGKANETNTLWLAKTEQTKHLYRYKKLVINEKAYEVTVINDTDPIIRISLIEGYINPEEDLIIEGNEIADGLVEINYKVSTNIDGITQLPNSPFILGSVLYKDGELEDAQSAVTVSNNATYVNNLITPLGVGVVTINISYPGYPVSKQYSIEIVEEAVTKAYYEILGPDNIDMYGQRVYQLVKNVNGTIEVLNGNAMNIYSEDLSKASITKTLEYATVLSKKIGTVRLYAIVGEERIEKVINIISPW